MKKSVIYFRWSGNAHFLFLFSFFRKKINFLDRSSVHDYCVSILQPLPFLLISEMNKRAVPVVCLCINWFDFKIEYYAPKLRLCDVSDWGNNFGCLLISISFRQNRPKTSRLIFEKVDFIIGCWAIMFINFKWSEKEKEIFDKLFLLSLHFFDQHFNLSRQRIKSSFFFVCNENDKRRQYLDRNSYF